MSAKVAVYISGFVCLLISFAYYQYLQRPRQLEIEETVAFELKNIIQERPTSYKKIAVGTNANVDLIVSGVALLRALGVAENEQGSECGEIGSLHELEQCFSYFMAKGAAAERPIASNELNLEIVTASSKLSEAQHFVGGNAALIGLKLAELVPHVKVMLCGPVGPKLKILLPGDILVPERCQMSGDENHLILEYQKNEQWGKNRAPIANRFIISHDIANSALLTLEPFIDETLSFEPDLVVVSGFHLLDGKDVDFSRQRISDAAKAFARLPRSVPIHLELASMSHCVCIRAIVEQLFPLVDSIGLNEQELVFISRCLGGIHANVSGLDKSVEIVSTDEADLGYGFMRYDVRGKASSPVIAYGTGVFLPGEGFGGGFYGDIISWILDEYGKNGKHFKDARLSRIHFHCLYVHILAVMPDYWRSNEASVSAGSWTAFSQACDTDTASRSKAELKIPNEFPGSLSSSQTIKFRASEPVRKFTKDDIELFISPVLICKRPLKTVGLGDAISASGLLYNVFLN